MPCLRDRLLGNEKGFTALTLALVGMIFTTMLVIPYLFYVETSLRSVRTAGKDLASLSCGTAAMEYALWRLQYDTAFSSSITTLDPTASFTVPCDDQLVPVTVTMTVVPSNLPEYLLKYGYADIVMVMDVTESVSITEMDSFKQAANAIVNGFDLPQNGNRYRFGVTQFGGTSRSVVRVTNNATTLQNGINSLVATDGLTCAQNPSHYAYAMRGNGARTFWRYDMTNQNWITKANTLEIVGDGGGLAFDGIYLFALRGGNTTTFWQYNSTGNDWTIKSVAPGAIGTGGALVYANSYLFALQGNNNTGFFRYDPVNSSWTTMAATPAAVGAGGVGGGALAYDGDYIYALRGANTTTFWRYDIAGDSWTTMAALPAAVGDGGALVYGNGAIYALSGNNSTGFYRYNISGDSWDTLAVAPAAIGTGGVGGGSLAHDGTYIYALRGTGTDTYWRYNITGNSWGALNSTTQALGDGGALTHAGYYIGCGTDIVAGLNGGADQYSTGLGDRTKVPNLMIFMTDGNDGGNNNAAIQTAADATGARRYAVGIDAVFVNTLYAIASEPDAEHYFYANSFPDLLSIIDQIVALVKQGALAGDMYDIEVIAPDGTHIQTRVLKTLEGTIVVISTQEV